MWQAVLDIECNVLSEILTRLLLLSAVCMMNLYIQPHMRHISEAELLAEYRRPRRDSYIPPWIMVFLVAFVPLIFMLYPLLSTRKRMDTIEALLAWTLATTINAFITETVKLIVGRPRPDFFYRCFPNGKITKGLQCTGNLRDIMEGRKSFPSGHSSFSFCSLGFSSIWLCGKLGVLSKKRGQGIRLMACLIPLILASAVALSRCCDNHHHWQDVLAGSLLGFTTSYFCYRQHYYPLDSELSGCPYAIVGEKEICSALSEIQCCTRDMNDEACRGIHLSNKNSLHGKKKYL